MTYKKSGPKIDPDFFITIILEYSPTDVATIEKVVTFN